MTITNVTVRVKGLKKPAADCKVQSHVTSLVNIGGTIVSFSG